MPRGLSVLGVSHALDGLLRHPAAWVCFTPQPRPGFALQGFCLASSRIVSSTMPCPLVVGAAPLPVLPPAPRHVAPPSGLCLRCPSPSSPRRGLAIASTRSPRELRLLQVLPLDVVRTPSRPLPLDLRARWSGPRCAGLQQLSPSSPTSSREAADLPEVFACRPSLPFVRDVDEAFRFSSRRLNRTANRFRIESLCTACASAAQNGKLCSLNIFTSLALWTKM